MPFSNSETPAGESFPERQGGEFAAPANGNSALIQCRHERPVRQYEACNFIKGESGRIVLVVPIASKPRAIMRAVQLGVGDRELYKNAKLRHLYFFARIARSLELRRAL